MNLGHRAKRAENLLRDRQLGLTASGSLALSLGRRDERLAMYRISLIVRCRQPVPGVGRRDGRERNSIVALAEFAEA